MSTYSGNIVGVDFSGRKKKTTETPVSPTERTKTEDRYARYSKAPVKSSARETETVRVETKPAVQETVASAAVEASNKKGITPLRMFLAFVVVAILMLVWVWMSVTVRQEMLMLEQLKDKQLEAQKANESLQAEITRLSNYERIAKIAKEQLKMKPATEKPGVIFLDTEKQKMLQDAEAKKYDP
ncbi:cell division protein FtsL [bacterium]|nr:cell division protein FtsL [bacterium]NUN45738.1 cell division protein FtsL [bacterium]